MSTTILGTIDAGGEGKAVLLAALNQALGKNFTLAEFTFSDPVAITIPTPTRNTMIKLAPLAASGYYGVRKVYYNRIHVSELGQIVVSRGAATRVSDLLPQINEKYGVYIQPTDIYDGLLPAVVPGETEVQITLNFRPSSIIFYGGVQIILGSNDPNSGGGSGGGTVLPFAGETMLFTTQATKRLAEGGTDETFIIDPFSTYIDADKTRKRFGSVVDETGSPSFDKFFKRSYLAADWLALEKKELIVFSWRNAINEVFAINIYGDVFKAALNGLSWSFVSNVIGFTYTTQNDVEEVQAYRPIVHAGRAPTGQIYVICATAGTAFYVRKSTDDGATWAEVYGVGSTQNQGYNITGYESGAVHYEDSMIHGGKLWTIVHSTNPYNAKPGSEPTGPAVECLDLTTFAMDYFTLGEVFAKYSQQNFELIRGECRLTFVTPENDLVAFPRVAALARMRDSSRMFLIMYTKIGNGYEAEVVGNATLSRELLDDNNRFISAYSIPLQKNDTLSLDVIELGCRVPTNTLPYETYAMGVRERTQDAFKVHGVKVYTSVRDDTARNAWVESNVSLGDGSAHKRIIINTPSKRMHFVAQPENALARMRFTEDNAIAGFRATADVSITLDKHSGFSTLSGHGSGIYSNPVVLETLNTSYGMTEFVDEESTKQPINYSFIARDQQNNYVWLVSALPNSPLQERTFSREYSYIGKTPLLVASNGADLFVWSQFGNGIYRSGNSGNFWEFNGQTEVFYNQTLSDKPERNILGMAEIAVKPERFKNGSFIGDNSIIDIEFAEPAKVTDSLSLEFNKVVSFNGRVLFSNNGLPNATNRGYNSQTALGGYGVNFYGAFAPKKLLAWETDSTTNAAIGVSMITVNNAQPYGELYGRNNYSAYIENDFVVLDINTKVKFLDINQIIYGYRIISGNEVHMLKLVDNFDVVTTIELFGGSNPSLNTFKPKAAFGLWEFADANYVPYIYYDDKKILLITRLREDGTFTNTIHLINVPADNGGALEIVPMFNANRREYYFAQRSNGIFKLNYTYSALTKTAVLSLNRVFTLNGTAANLTIVSGTVRQLPVVIEPTVPLIPTFPPNGTLISTFCDGTTKTGVYADGSGGTYNQVVELESPDCGFTPDTPTPAGATTTTMTLNTTSATADLIETSVIAAENGTAYAIYELSEGLNANTDVVLSFIPGTASLADISAIAYRIGNGSFIAASLPQTITIPAGQTEIVVRITYVADGVTEGNELFTLRVAKSVGNTQITNTDPIDTIFTITDSVVGSRWPINNNADYLDDFENANKTWSSTNFQALYNSPNANPVSTNYIAQDKVLRVVQNPVQSGNRQHTNLLPLGDIRFSNIRYTVDLFISKVLVQDTVSGDYSLIDYDAPLTGNQQYEESSIRLSSYDQDTNSYGTDISVFFCLSGTTDQMVRGGNSGSKTELGTRVDSSLGMSMVTIPRGGDIRLTIEITDDGAGKKHQVFVNDILVHTAGSGQYVAGSLIAVGAMLGDLSCRTVDIRRVMIEDTGPPASPTMSVDNTTSFDGYLIDTSINTSTEPNGAVVYKLSSALAAASDYVIDITDGTAIASKMPSYHSGALERVRTGEQAFFVEEGGSFSNWTVSNCTFSTDGTVNRLTKTTGGSGATATIPVTFPATTKDWLLYGKVRSSNNGANDISAIFLLNGAKETSIWFGTGTANSSFAEKRISINGTIGASSIVHSPAADENGGGLFEYDTQFVEFVLHHDQYFDCLTLWIKKSDGTWYFSTRIQCDGFQTPEIMIAKSFGAPAGSWFEFEYLQGSTPNFFAIGDSVTAGAPNFGPNPVNNSTGRQDYWASVLKDVTDVRNSFVVNRGEELESTQILSRVAEIVAQGPQLVFMGLSTNDQILGISAATRTATIQDAINQFNAQCPVVIYNGVYGTQTSPDNTPSNALKNYMLNWWNQELKTLTGNFVAIDTMKVLANANGFMDTAYTHADGVHPNTLGYSRISTHIAGTLNNRVKSLVFRSGTVNEQIYEVPATVSFEAGQSNAVLVINSNNAKTFNSELDFVVSIMKASGNTSVTMPVPLEQVITLEPTAASGELIPTTWSSTLSQPGAVLSNSDLTVTASQRAVTEFSAATGKYYVELTGSATLKGIADVSEDSSTTPGMTNYSVAYNSTDGGIYVNGGPVGTGIQANATVVRVLIDVDNKLVRFAADGNTISGPFVLQGDAFRIAVGNGTATINAGASAFTYAVPEGYTPGFGQDTNPANDTLAFTATRLNSFDAGSSVSLDDSGLVANFGYYFSSVRSKFSVNSGKWAIEVKPTISQQYAMIGISTSAAPVQSPVGAYPGANNNGWSYYGSTGELYRNDAGTAYGVPLQPGDIVTMLLDMDNGTLSFLVNGVDQGVAVTGITGDYFAHFGDGASTTTAMEVNFGAKPFTYPVPAGFVKGFGVENIVPTKYNSVIPKSLGDFAVISNGGDFVNFSGWPVSNVQSYRKVSSGKWSWELKPTYEALALRIGICRPTVVAQAPLGAPTAEGFGYQGELGDVNNSPYGAPFSEGDVITVLLDLDNGTLSFMKNGVDQGVAATGLTGEWRAAVSKAARFAWPRVDTNFGDRPFKYPVPAGYVKGFGHIR
jgi:lysophospholipase L1-like esterase